MRHELQFGYMVAWFTFIKKCKCQYNITDVKHDLEQLQEPFLATAHQHYIYLFCFVFRDSQFQIKEN
jgi:hypothetical protein